VKHLIIIAIFALFPLWYYLFVRVVVWAFKKYIWDQS